MIHIIREGPAVLELLRASNLPTIWTNVLVGLLLSGADAPRALLAFPALSLIYLGGMALNDCCDLDWDRQHKPDKPIPSGRLALWQAALVSVVLLGGGMMLTPGPWAPALVGCVVAYNLLHKRSALATLLMGACRGLVYPCVAGGLTPALLAAGVVVTAYVTLLTLLARKEAFQRLPGGGLRWLELATLLSLLGPWPASFWLTASLARARFLAGRGEIKSMVLTLIAAISLLDGCLLAAAGFPAWPGLAGFVVTRLWHRRVSGT